MVFEQNKRVLVVDDDADIRLLLSTILTQQGLTVDQALDGQEALQLIAENRYAVVLLDLFMPVVDGFQVLRALGADEMQSPPVVLVVTGADRQSIERLNTNQIHGVVRKPFDPEELASLVKACAEIKARGGFGPMALAMLSSAGMIQWLVNKG